LAIYVATHAETTGYNGRAGGLTGGIGRVQYMEYITAVYIEVCSGGAECRVSGRQ